MVNPVAAVPERLPCGGRDCRPLQAVERAEAKGAWRNPKPDFYKTLEKNLGVDFGFKIR